MEQAKPNNDGRLSRRNLFTLGLAASTAALVASCEVSPQPPETTPTSTTLEPAQTYSHLPDPLDTKHYQSSTPKSTTKTPTSSSPLTTSEKPSSPPTRQTTTTPRPTIPSSNSSSASEKPVADSELVKYLPSKVPIRFGPGKRREVAVTIDDWSGSAAPKYLEQLLDLADNLKTNYTLFPIGRWLDIQHQGGYAELWQRAANSGHVIGNHTWDHQLLGDLSTSAIKSELSRQQDALNETLGYEYKEYLMRPPGGSGGFNTYTPGKYQRDFEHVFPLVRELGYYMAMWTTDSNASDGRIITPDEDNRFLRKIFNGDPQTGAEKVRPGSVILVHPQTLSIDGMKRLMDGLATRGLTNVTLPQLFAPTNQ